MANTDKQNFRYDKRRWEIGTEKASAMRDAGYDVDMTAICVRAVDQFVDETVEETATRLGLTKADGPVALRRRREAASA